jgi:hypothetical protein
MQQDRLATGGEGERSESESSSLSTCARSHAEGYHMSSIPAVGSLAVGGVSSICEHVLERPFIGGAGLMPSAHAELDRASLHILDLIVRDAAQSPFAAAL